jgi:uncharacterized membrane protein YtjA (UPF0391 family)
LVLSVVAAVVGFGGLAGDQSGMVRILFWIFMILFWLNYLFGRRIWGQGDGEA